MPASVELVARADALSRLCGLIDELKAGDSLRAVTVIAPTSRSALALGGDIAKARASSLNGAPVGLANVNYVTVARLAEHLGAWSLEAEGRRALSRPALVAAVRVALGPKAVRFGPAGAHLSTAAEIADRYEELRLAGRLEGDASETLALSRGASDVYEVCVVVRRSLVERHYDDVDLLARARDLARAKASDLGSIVVYLPEPMRPAELSFVRALSDVAPSVSLVGLTGSHDADRSILEIASALGDVRGDHVDAEEASVAPEALLLAANPRGEVRAALSLALDRIGAGVAAERIAIVYPTRGPYLRLLVSELRASGVSFSAASPNALASYLPGPTLAALFALARGPLRRDALMELCRSGPILARDGSPAPVGEWDRATRLAGVVEATSEEWTERLAEIARRSGAFRDDVAPSPAGAPPSRGAAAAEGLSNFVSWLDDAFEDGRRRRGWRALVEWTRSVLQGLFGEALAVDAWSDQASSVSLYESLLDELAKLDEFEPSVDLVGFLARFLEELRRPGPRLGSNGGIVVAAFDGVAALELDTVVALGATSANLPARSARSPLFSASDRELLGLEERTAARLSAEARRRLSLLRRSARELIVTAPSLDQSGRMTALSRLVKGASRVEVLPGELGALSRVAEGGRARSEENLEIAAMFAAPRGASVARAASLGLVGLVRAASAIEEREAARFGPYSGVVEVRDESLWGPFSPTTLEVAASCPFRYFLAHTLRVEALDAPERRFEIEPRDRGSLAHEALERYVTRVMADEPATDAERAALLREITDGVIVSFERVGRTGKRATFELERRTILQGLEIERRSAEAGRRIRGGRPVAVEHAFGFGDVDPVVVQLSTRSVAFRGKIDLVDEEEDGSISVVDYKTGSSRPYEGLAEDPIDAGRRLQLPIYTLAARSAFGKPGAPTRAAYRFISTEPSEIGIDLDERVEGRLIDALEALTDTIGAGRFPMRPGEMSFGRHANCRWCDYDSVCPKDRARAFEGARSSGLIDRYLALGEPPDEDEAVALVKPCGDD